MLFVQLLVTTVVAPFIGIGAIVAITAIFGKMTVSGKPATVAHRASAVWISLMVVLAGLAIITSTWG